MAWSALMDKPVQLFENPIDRFAIHAQPVLKPQLYPESAIAKRGIKFADSRAFFWLPNERVHVEQDKSIELSVVHRNN
ncbi:MAG: hypothetical protein OJF50_003028 [Nitrospira sp.]|jgi:hypothetical protein|nr:hypothetical protein [Nitrospira sp.]